MHKRRYRKPVARYNYLNTRTSDFLKQILVIAGMVIDDDSGGVVFKYFFAIPDVIPTVEADAHHFSFTFSPSTTSPEHGHMFHHGCPTNLATPCPYTFPNMTT